MHGFTPEGLRLVKQN